MRGSGMEMENVIKNDKSNKKIEIDKKERLNIALYLSGRLVSLFGTYIYSFAIALYILKVTGSGTSFAISVLMGMLPRVILGPFAGALADRIDRKKLVVGLDILSGMVVLGLVGVSTLYGLKIPYIYVATLMLAVINTFFDISINASLPNLVKDGSLLKINSYSQAASSLASILSPVIGGIAFVVLPIKLFLLINGLSFIVSAVSEMFINFKFNKSEETDDDKAVSVVKGSVLDDIKEVIEFIKEQKALYALLKYALLLNFFVNAALAVSFPYIINTVFKMTSTQFGIIEGAFSVGILGASLVIGKLPEKEKKLKTLVVGLIINGLMLIAMGLPVIKYMGTTNINILFVYYIVVCLIFAVFMVFVNVPLNVTLQRLTPDKLRGRLMGVLGTLTGGIAPLGVIITGITIDIAPPYIIPILAGIIITLSAIFMSRNKALQEY